MSAVRRAVDVRAVRALADGTVAADRFGGVWVVEDWVSVASGFPQRERCWYTTGDKKSYSDEEVADLGPMTVMRVAALPA